VATGFAVAAVPRVPSAAGSKQRLPSAGLGIALTVAAVSSPLQIVSGDVIARMVAEQQPAKFRRDGGSLPDRSRSADHHRRYPERRDDERPATPPDPLGVELARPARRTSLRPRSRQHSRDEWPNTRIVHWAFDLMVATGFAMLILAAWAGWLWWRRRRLPDDRWLLRALVVAGPLGFIAIEAGWVVTEVGRQPWIFTA